MFRSSRKFYVSLVALLCLLGAFTFAQNAPKPAAPTADDFNQFSWRFVGPTTFSGRITAFAVPPGQSTTYYVLTATGGIWKTEDAGIHFEPIFDKGDTLSMGWLAIAPSNKNVLYLGTGEPMHARSSTHGKGVYKSTDAGKTWTHVGLSKSYFIPKVAVDPKNADIVYVAAEGKLYDNETDCERGLFKSVDGGKTWTNLGPMKDRGIADFVMDPRNGQVIIAATYKTFRRAWTYLDRHQGNELYKTTNGGKTWTKLTTGLPQNVAIGRIGLDIYAKNPNIVYARMDEEVVLGFQEREGGASFRVAPAGPGGGRTGAAPGTPLFGADFSLAQFKTFKINPEMAALAPKFTPVTGATEADLVKKFNELISDKDFVTKSGADLAKMIAATRRLHASNESLVETVGEVEKLSKKPAAGNGATESAARTQIVNRAVLEMLYAGALSNLPPVKQNGVVYRSDDQGKTWKRMTQYTIAAATAPRGRDAEVDESQDEAAAQSDTVLTVAQAPAATAAPAATRAGRAQATAAAAQDAGSPAQVNQTEGGYYGRIIIDPNNDKTLYCGDTNTTVSVDAGKTFKVTGWDGNGKTHVDHRVVWVDPLNSNHILSGNDGGVSETWDGGKHFSQKNTINVQQFYDVAVDNELPYNVMGGTQDNGAWLGPSQNRNSYGLFPADWLYLPTGDAFYVVRDWWNPEYVYYESQFGSSSRMNLKTGEVSSLAVRLTPEQIAAGEAPVRYQWNAPIVLSPHNPGIVYIAGQHVYRSLSRGERGTFVRISPDLTRASAEKLALARKTNLQWATVYTFAESPRKPGLFWAGTDDGNVQLSTDNGNTWVNITNQFYDAAGNVKPGVKGDVIPYDRWVKRVVPSAFDDNTCYVAFSGYRTHNEDKTWLFVTRDLGKTWTDISGGMMNPVWDVEEDPENANVLYLGTDYGIFLTVDQGKTWSNFSTSMPPVPVRDLAIQKRDREMAIGTYGRGIFIADIGPIKEFKPAVFESAAHLFDVKNTIRWNRFERRGDTLGEMAKVDNPPVGASIYYYLKADAKSVKVTIKDLEGATIQELTPAGKKGLQVAFWNLQRQAPAGAPAFAGGRMGGRPMVEAGVYKVTLTVDDKEVVTKKMTVSPDPMFK